MSVFLGGILSFFSPCILPVIPLYIGYLSGGNLENKKNITINTIFFTLGISFSFVILSFGFSTIGILLQEYREIISKISGVLIILFGLFQLGFLKISSLERERKLFIEFKKMNPFIALLLGFTFSFAWTPCIGPTLSSILITITSLEEIANGYILMGTYTLGFILPFILTGIFSTYLLKFFRNNMKVIKYTTKIMGVLLILLGILTFTGKLNEIIGYLV
ncbi:cytochrome c biogenesis CcdA family protein [Fusobacterium sp.]|uniref:cytochrome c biogenesis CcdA family protein n=1 Tax=Fusobacterium sp. TaxID=68766 RepID=UPI00262FD594|nr:cytochrome c biogenesis CcdA family protein [Fusobacterium sp.]